MKRKLLIALSALGFGLATQAQNVRINLYSAYVFDDKVDSRYDANNYYSGTVKGGYQWGGGIEYMLRPNQGIELMYLRQNTTAPLITGANPVVPLNYSLGINYVMLASNRYFSKPGGKVEGFAGGMLGMDIVSVKNPNTNSKNTVTKFAWGIRGGANIWATERVGIKLQVQLLSAVQSLGGGITIGTGGVGAGVGTYSSIYQFGLGGGLVFRLPGSAGAKK